MRELFYLTLALTTLLVVSATSDFMSLESFLQPLKDEAAVSQLLNTATTPNEKPTPTQDNSEGGGGGGAIFTTTTTSEYSSLRPPMQEVALPPTPNKDEGPLHTVGNMDNVPEQQHKQHIITYDQRQEGQYNVRADLENFMIVLVPPNPAQGLNLLDLLAKSKFRRGSTLAMKERHKLYPALTETAERAVDHGGYPKAHAKKPLTKYGPKLEQVGHGKPEFIEGRTPYHVDISANDEAQSRLQPDRQVDVLPPPYYPHLPFKPVHLEAEPTVIQALPPTDLGRYNLLEVANAGIAGYNNNNQQALQNARGFYRDSRAIRADNLLDSNRLAAGAALEPSTRAVNVPLYRTDLGNVHGHGLYSPIDAPDFQTVDSTRAWRLVDVADVDSVPRHLVKNVDLEFDLIGDDFDDLKLLLGDGLERCAPGHRRDSYGVCREIEGY